MSDMSDNDHMTKGTNLLDADGIAMRERLKEKLDQAGISMRNASANAGFGNGYVQSVVKDGIEPTVKKLAKICEANGISFAYVLFGIEMSPETRKLLKLMESDPAKRDGILALLSGRPAP